MVRKKDVDESPKRDDVLSSSTPAKASNSERIIKKKSQKYQNSERRARPLRVKYLLKQVATAVPNDICSFITFAFLVDV